MRVRQPPSLDRTHGKQKHVLWAVAIVTGGVGGINTRDLRAADIRQGFRSVCAVDCTIRVVAELSMLDCPYRFGG